jgi:transposase InsO family protein
MRDARLGAKIAEIHARSGSSYGSPRVHDELREDGEHVGRKRVARLMQERELSGKRRRRFRITTQSNHALPLASNVLARDFSATAPNEKWVGDITYIWTREGWLYLAVLIDLFSRRVVGWSMGEMMVHADQRNRPLPDGYIARSMRWKGASSSKQCCKLGDVAFAES